MTFCAYLLTIDSCPYAFGTAGCPSTVTLPPTVTPTLFDWADEWVVQVGMLAWPEGVISEHLALSDGQLSVSGLDFEIHADHVLSGGPYDGQYVLRLFTTRASRIAQSALTASFTAGGATMTLASGAGFPSGDQVVWCEQQALRVSRSGTTLTVSASPVGWGYYGSRSNSHAIDAGRGYSPIVWAEFPGVERRRCTLWEVDEDGYATAVWRGRVTRPHMAEDGGNYMLSCDHAWDTIKDTRPGGAGATVTLSGWWMRGVDSVVDNGNVVGALRAIVNGTPGQAESVHGDAETERVCASLDELASLVQARLQASLIAEGYTTTFATVTLSEGGGIVLTAVGPDSELTDVNLTVGGDAFTVRSEDNTASGGVRTCTATIPADKMTGAYIPTNARGPIVATVNLDTTLGFPASFSRSTITSNPGLVTHETVLMGELDDPALGDRFLLAFRPTSVDADEGTATGTFEYVPRTREGRALPGNANLALTRPQTLKLVDCITAAHWAYAIDRALTSWTVAKRAPVDARDWSRVLEPRVVAATDGTAELARARWYLDGERTFGELVSSQCRLNGCAVGVRNDGRMCLVPLRPPLPTDELAATFTAADYLEGHPPRFALSDESVRTSAQLKTANLTTQVNDLDAEARYGATAPMELEAVGAIEGLSQEAASPDLIAAQLLRYVLGSWSGPCSVHTLTVSYDTYGQRVFLGDAVAFDSFNAPDGAGGRGLTAQRGIVVGREASLEGEDALALTVLVFEEAERIAAVAPSWRISGISGAVLTVAIDYLTGSATDYSGSNSASYRYLLTAGEDGGTSHAWVGAKVRLVTSDATSELSQGGLEVASFDPTAKTITLTGSVPTSVQNWTTYIAGGGIADLVLDDYADAGDDEHDFAYVGDEATATIDGTTDAPNRLAP